MTNCHKLRHTLRFACLLVLAALSGHAIVRADETPFPKTSEFVNDWAHVLSPDDVRSLTETCRGLQTAHGYQLLVVTLPTLNGEDINHAATRFGNEQQAGRKGADTGIVLMLAMQEHKVYIATGSGTEAVLTDVRCTRITRDIMRPLLREGRTGDAVKAGVQSITTLIESGGESEPMPLDNGSGSRGPTGGIPMGLIFFGVGGVALIAIVATRAMYKCPRCGHWMTISNEVVQSPGLLSNGYGIRTRTCASCGFSDKQRYTIYRNTGAGGGFIGGGGGWGGGSSGGGGFSGGGFSGGGGSFGGGGGGSSW